MGRLDDVDLSLKLSRKDSERQLEEYGGLLAQLRLALGGIIGSGRIGPPLCVLFEGWDAGGKGGAIKRLVAPLDARHVRVTQFAAPPPDHKRHHYLSGFVHALPGWGGMAILDRTWYGRVLVERVEGFASKDEWRRAYREIDDFERALSDDGMILVKFFLHVSDEEQLERLGATTRLSRGSSPTRTGATGASERRTPTRSRRCSIAPTPTRPRGGSSRASPSTTRACT